jgi:hypothetical protein
MADHFGARVHTLAPEAFVVSPVYVVCLERTPKKLARPERLELPTLRFEA